MTLLNDAFIRTADNAEVHQVRQLLPEGWTYTVQTRLVAGYLGAVLFQLRTDHDSAVVLRDVFSRHKIDDAHDVIAKLIAKLEHSKPVNVHETATIVAGALPSVFGQQMSVQGWIPGYRVLNERELHVVTGHRCPTCKINPLTVADRGRQLGCLNGEDCGFHVVD